MPGGEILSSLKRIYGADLNWVLSADDRIEETGIVSLSVRDTQAGCLEPDLSEFLSLPLYELDVAAGGGAEISRENVVTTLAFRRDWLAHEGLHSSKLVLVRVAGDSMEPTIADGGTILIDQAQTQIKNEKIFVFRYEDEGFVKRMRKAGDRAIVVSDNRSYPDWDAPLAELAIIGRVVWAARKVP